jgi:hypothetical protein
MDGCVRAGTTAVRHQVTALRAYHLLGLVAAHQLGGVELARILVAAGDSSFLTVVPELADAIGAPCQRLHNTCA